MPESDSECREPEYTTTCSRGGKKGKARDQLERSLPGRCSLIPPTYEELPEGYRRDTYRSDQPGTLTKLRLASGNSDWHPVTPPLTVRLK